MVSVEKAELHVVALEKAKLSSIVEQDDALKLGVDTLERSISSSIGQEHALIFHMDTLEKSCLLSNRMGKFTNHLDTQLATLEADRNANVELQVNAHLAGIQLTNLLSTQTINMTNPTPSGAMDVVGNDNINDNDEINDGNGSSM